MIFHADSESDLKTTPNHVKNKILSKIRFLWYFDLKFPPTVGLKIPSRRTSKVLDDSVPLGEFKVEVIFFPRGAPRGDPQGGSPGGVPGGVPGSCSGFPSGEKI